MEFHAVRSGRNWSGLSAHSQKAGTKEWTMPGTCSLLALEGAVSNRIPVSEALPQSLFLSSRPGWPVSSQVLKSQTPVLCGLSIISWISVLGNKFLTIKIFVKSDPKIK